MYLFPVTHPLFASDSKTNCSAKQTINPTGSSIPSNLYPVAWQSISWHFRCIVNIMSCIKCIHICITYWHAVPKKDSRLMEKGFRNDMCNIRFSEGVLWTDDKWSFPSSLQRGKFSKSFQDGKEIYQFWFLNKDKFEEQSIYRSPRINILI